MIGGALRVFPEGDIPYLNRALPSFWQLYVIIVLSFESFLEQKASNSETAPVLEEIEAEGSR